VAAATLLLLSTFAQAGGPLHADAVTVAGSGSELDRATRGRSALVWNGLRIAVDHPVFGVGVGAFEHAYLESYEPPPGLENPVSHTTPVTIVAETGVVGLALFGWLLVAAALVALRRLRRETPSLTLTRVTAGVCVATIFVHSLFYNAFLEDPMTWGFLALAVLVGRATAERT
jgi:O-antigen ligase